MKILVVDDDKEICAVIEDFLKEQGFSVTIANNGSTGLKCAQADPPNLIVLDVELPDMTGYQVCERLRENAPTRHTPVIMLTGLSNENSEVVGLKSGADDFVAKPFKPRSLLARIQVAIGRSENQLDANALTHLPGNLVIIKEIEKRISSGEKFAVLYLDLNNFKSFNDRYGFVRGDEAIKKTAELLGQSLAKHQKQKPFLGHVGGDDFVAVLETDNVEPVCQEIIAHFDAAIPALYDEPDRVRGMISSVDRKGNRMDIPLMGIAVAAVTNRFKAFKHPGEISFIAGDLKKGVKNKNSSGYMIDRRS